VLRKELSDTTKEIERLKMTQTGDQRMLVTNVHLTWTAALPPRHRFTDESRYDYDRALRAASEYDSAVHFYTSSKPPPKKRCMLDQSVLINCEERFLPSTKICSMIDDVIKSYEIDRHNPRFNNLEISMQDFSAKTLPIAPPRVFVPEGGAYPESSTPLHLNHYEADRLDFLGRALVKIHEVDDAFINSILKIEVTKIDIEDIDQATNEADRKELESAHRANLEYLRIADAIRLNHTRRCNLIANLVGMITVIRRRDNIDRVELDAATAKAVLTATILQNPDDKLITLPTSSAKRGPDSL
jgi:hypothetical protein